MARRKTRGILIAAFLWLFIFAALAVAYKYFVRPHWLERLSDQTGTESHYKHSVTLTLDSFSGYCVLRSDYFEKELKSRGIKLTLEDDNADYVSRIESLRKGKTELAVFTIDSYLATGAGIDEYPGSIILVIDESKGADGIVAFPEAVGSFEDLNDPGARFVLTPDSPSEFLARVIIAHLDLPDLPEQWREEADGVEEVYRRLRSGGKGARRAYVLWQPFLSRAVEEEKARILFDTSKLNGYIIDVLIAEREFLRDRPEVVRDIVEAYLQSVYHYGETPEGLADLVREDSKRYGSGEITRAQAEGIVEGIWWKNTLENYAHFGILKDNDGRIPYLEDIIDNITDVLRRTGAIDDDPLEGRSNLLFYRVLLEDMQRGGFHPGRKINLVEGLGTGPENDEKLRPGETLAALTDSQWESLVPVGTMRVDAITFSRGTAKLSVQSRRELDALAKRLEAWPQYYLLVAGHTRSEGDPEANRRLAEARAGAAREFLIEAGVGANRIRTRADAASGSQSVSFVLGQLPY